MLLFQVISMAAVLLVIGFVVALFIGASNLRASDRRYDAEAKRNEEELKRRFERREAEFLEQQRRRREEGLRDGTTHQG